ncbi:efflux RND transporter periplasmic adaptor subunit [Mucilaginibacter ginkgonis]|uniref:Efflux RND transporter periplasmic adaptor subunit n=2 Tax=Mucilaginibacter ginkgonis TaxID=2682091 RepID=A0A6I4HWT3_9SPHI|nr:efflux RND transporter periplasmic adaptor subunit [Mucilaginibacter ginkgonis]
MKLRYPALALMISVGLFSCKGKDDKQAQAPQATPVSIDSARIAKAIYYDPYQATIVALKTVEIRSQIQGFITGIFFKEGSVVKQGQPLYEIDKRKYLDALQQQKANLSSAIANQVKAQKDADRYSFLLKNDAVARQTYDQAIAQLQTNKSQVAVARAAVASAQTDLSYATIRAPFTGRIGISQVKLGAQITPGSTLLNTLSSENPIAADIIVNESDINRFYGFQKQGSDSTFRLQLSDGTKYLKPGKIFAIDRGVNNQTGSIKVRVQFPNDQDILKDGMSAVLNVLNTVSGDRVQIPYKAITEQMGEFFVFVAKDTTVTKEDSINTVKKDTAAAKAGGIQTGKYMIAKQQKVTIGPRVNADVVVLSGLKAGQRIVTAGFQRLKDGGKITLGQPQGQGAPGQGGGQSQGGGQGQTGKQQGK